MDFLKILKAITIIIPIIETLTKLFKKEKTDEKTPNEPLEL